MFTIKKHNGRIRIFFLGVRIFSYRSRNSLSNSSNSVEVGKNVKLQHKVTGKNNIIKIGDCQQRSRIKISIKGDNNRIEIKNPAILNGATIDIGNYTGVNNATFFADDHLACGHSKFLLYQHDSKIEIGKNCLFSWGISMRTGELPHVIFDKNSGEYLDKGKGITIGDHVWIGEGCFLMKNAVIANNCVVGAASVVTKAFTKEYTLVAGNPAKVCKEDIVWDVGACTLDKESIYYQNLPDHIK